MPKENKPILVRYIQTSQFIVSTGDKITNALGDIYAASPLIVFPILVGVYTKSWEAALVTIVVIFAFTPLALFNLITLPFRLFKQKEMH
jgi:hypothetical protein